MIAKMLLIVLIGIYAVRASWFFFTGQLSPLTPVAAVVLGLCIYLFNRLPEAPGLWLYAVLGACAIGTLVNGSLFFATSPLYRNPTNFAFNAACMLCFVGVAVERLWVIYASGGRIA